MPVRTPGWFRNVASSFPFRQGRVGSLKARPGWVTPVSREAVGGATVQRDSTLSLGAETYHDRFTGEVLATADRLSENCPNA